MQDKKAERLKRIEGYKAQKENERSRQRDEYKAALEEIKSLEGELRDVMDVANAAKAAGIDLLRFTHYRSNVSELRFIDYSSGRISRPIAIVGNSSWQSGENVWVGFDADGLLEVHDKLSDGTVHEDFTKGFAKNWTLFREKFYEYIDKECGMPEDAREETMPVAPGQEQIWLARVAYAKDMPPRKTVVKLVHGPQEGKLYFRDLDSAAPFNRICADDISMLALLTLVKDWKDD